MSKSRVRGKAGKVGVVLAVLILLMSLFFSLQFFSAQRTGVWNVPVKPTPQPESENPTLLDQIAYAFKPLTDALGLTSEDTGSEPVGLDVQVGYTGTSGESVVYSESVLSGVGLLTHSGIFVKPSLGKYKALKLYDKDKGVEGEIWVKPIIRIRVFNGTPEEWAFHLKTKVVADEDIIDIKTLDKSGKGVPPKRIEFEKVSVKGSTLHKILRGEIHSLGRLQAVPLQAPSGSRKICFYADYQGMMKFKDDPDPVVKELKNVKLACFDFEFKETGDFEMMTEENVTVRPLAEVMVGGESGMGGVETVTMTHTVTLPYKTYTTTVTSTYVSGGVTYTKTIVSTSISYRYYTLTKTKTVWKKTTIIKKVPGKPTTVTKTVTKYIYVGEGAGSVLGNVTVITPDGIKPIREVRPGDLVLTEIGFKEVKAVKEIEVFNLYRITLEDGRILLADDAQPVATSGGLKKVGELKLGDELMTLNWTSRIIDIERHELKTTVYDLMFDEPLNYYANGVLVNDGVKYSGVILLTWPWSEFVFISGSGVW